MIIGREIGDDHGEIWLATRQCVRGLLAGRTPTDMSRPVPATPGLIVRVMVDGGDTAGPLPPLDRINNPADIAGTVAYLVSPDARNVSGQLITVAGSLNPAL